MKNLPVTIIFRILAACKLDIISVVGFFNLFSITRNPKKVKFFSISLLCNLWIFRKEYFKDLEAQAKTRYPHY